MMESSVLKYHLQHEDLFSLVISLVYLLLDGFTLAHLLADSDPLVTLKIIILSCTSQSQNPVQKEEIPH